MILYLFAVAILMTISATLLVFGLSIPFSTLSVLSVVSAVIFLISGALVYMRGAFKYHLSIYELKDEFIKDNGLSQANLVLHHEKYYEGSPKRLYAVRVDGARYGAEECHEYRITSLHQAYIFNNIPNTIVVVIHNKETGEWETYTKASMD